MRQLDTRIPLVAIVGLLACCASCAQFPDVAHPGPAPYQRKRAEITDPYPEPDTGPEMVGARPRDFNKPAAEVERARHFNPQNFRPAVALPPQF